MDRFHVDFEDMKITTFGQKPNGGVGSRFSLNVPYPISVNQPTLNMGSISCSRQTAEKFPFCRCTSTLIFALLFVLAAWASDRQLAFADDNEDKYKGRIEENSTIKPEDLFFGAGVPSNYEILRRASSNRDGEALTTRKSLPANAFEHLWQTYTLEAAKAYKEKRLGDAETMYRAAVKQAEKFAPTDKRLATTLTNLGAVLRDEGKWEEAETIFKRALALKNEHLNPADPSLASTLNHYASLLRKMGRADEAQLLETRAQSISMLAANARQNQLALQNEAAQNAAQNKEQGTGQNTTEDSLLNAFASTDERPGQPQPREVGAQNNRHVITNVLRIAEQRRQQEPFWFTKQIVVAYGDPSGNWTTHIGPKETYAGYLDSGSDASETSTELYTLATKYGINDDRLEIIARNGGTLLEVDNNVLFYARCPISTERWTVGLPVEVGRPEFLEEPMYMIKSEGEPGQLIVREMAAR